MIDRVCEQHQLIKHSLFFILKKKVSKMDLLSRSQVNYIFVNSVILQNMSQVHRIIFLTSKISFKVQKLGHQASSFVTIRLAPS